MQGIKSAMRSESAKPHACVMGGIDLVRPLGLAGISCVVAARAGEPARHSRFATHSHSWEFASENVDEQVNDLVSFAKAQPEAPVLFYEDDTQLLLVSRNRVRLGEVFRFVVADSSTIEDLVDKALFQQLAERLALPVPAAQQIDPASSGPDDIELPFPLVLKPLYPRDRWPSVGGTAKALVIKDPEKLRRLWERMAAADMKFVVQHLVPGPESCIESYHVYVDRDGGIVGEFTGRKIRTYPQRCGHSTAVEITDCADVRTLGRAIVQKIALTGVAKLDFKRGPDNRLHLLEVNPRFNLWHHLGAIAGVNLPALVYCDLVGLPRPVAGSARPGTRWCRVWTDFRAAKANGIPITRWLPWALRSDAKPLLSWDDPMPLLRGASHRWRSRYGAAWLSKGREGQVEP